MVEKRTPPELVAAVRRITHPPLREGRFWVVQAMVALIFLLHQLDAGRLGTQAFTAIPHIAVEALFLLPLLYAALNFGLRGSLATAAWVTLLMSLDITLDLPGMGGLDLWAHYVELCTLDVVAFVVGWGVETERLARARAEATEARYRQLFETNRSPILVLDATGRITDANPAASVLLGEDVIGRSGATLFDGEGALPEQAGRLLSLADGRDYRVGHTPFSAGTDNPSTQVIFEDVTEERAEGRRASRYAQLVVQAEEDQRRRLARELHDEPLQLFLHLARRLDIVAGTPGAPATLASELFDIRHQALDAAARLRTLARDLRPPALDQLGLVAALSSLVADVEEEAGLVAELEVAGAAARLSPEVELAAFRVVEEAVRNTVHHAGARQLKVTVTFRSAELALRVADDGRGFAPEGLDGLGSGHLGLLGMAERARLLDGHLEVHSASGQGTVVEATIPVGARRGGRAQHAS